MYLTQYGTPIICAHGHSHNLCTCTTHYVASPRPFEFVYFKLKLLMQFPATKNKYHQNNQLPQHIIPQITMAYKFV